MFETYWGHRGTEGTWSMLEQGFKKLQRNNTSPVHTALSAGTRSVSVWGCSQSDSWTHPSLDKKIGRCSTIQPTNCVVVLEVSFRNLYEEKENPAVLRDEASFILSVLPTLCLISACKTASVLDSRDRRLPQVNGGDDETPFTTVLF